MTKRRFLTIMIIPVTLIALGCWWFFDFGLGYTSIELRRGSSFKVIDSLDVDFHSSQNHVVDYRVGRRASRSTTAHGYQDRIVIEFSDSTEASGLCKILQVARLGYRRGGEYRIASPEHAWVEVRQCEDHFYLEAAIKISNAEVGGSWEIVYIPPTKIE